MAAIREAGLVVEYQDDGTRLVVRDVDVGGCPIRTRAGPALAALLKDNRAVKALDISQSNIADNGVGHVCLVLRQTDQLEELALSEVGHAGLESLLSVVRRCGRLRSLSARLVDLPNRLPARENVVAADYDVSAFEGVKPEGEEEEEEAPAGGDEEDELTPEEREQKKLEKLREVFAENDFDSGDEGGAGAATGSADRKKPTSAALGRLLAELVGSVRKRDNLTFVECLGDNVPDDVRTDLARAVAEHQRQQQRKAEMRQERGARTAFDALRAQVEELRAVAEGTTGSGVAITGLLPGEDGGTDDASTHVGSRSFVGRRLFAALGESLFECQRFKSKENEAVSTWQGECAFIAMYLRKLAKERESR